MANCIIFAGVNGAGKTTLYKTMILKDDLGKRINTDEIVMEIGDWRNNQDQMRAGRIALNMRKECVDKMISFNQETTLTGKRILKAIEEIKEKGYTIYLYYIGLNSPEIAKERIKNRVLNGGHDIPEEVVEKRYYETLENLKKVVPLADYVRIYDNSKNYKLCYYKNKTWDIVLYQDLPKWLAVSYTHLTLPTNSRV